MLWSQERFSPKVALLWKLLLWTFAEGNNPVCGCTFFLFIGFSVLVVVSPLFPSLCNVFLIVRAGVTN